MKLLAAYSYRLLIRLCGGAVQFAVVKQSKLNDTVLWNLSKYSDPVRAYLHQINTPDSGDFSRMAKNFALAPPPNFLQSYWH
jgi:hypothetical protein